MVTTFYGDKLRFTGKDRAGIVVGASSGVHQSRTASLLCGFGLAAGLQTVPPAFRWHVHLRFICILLSL
ncbi:unnamed protein product [Gongylonema pulchrum]|uniref:Proteasome endopeptidase complex n=1 Tax=Gongylonema pulchrum TaxID=637853 RepID=A0A183DTV1_9BILA|nr:unnamed protein product [Gongylonema pulchrum]